MFKVKLLNDLAKAPVKAHDYDAGFDVFSNFQYEVTIYPGDIVKVPLGFAIELPTDYVALIQEKSGMAVKNGIMTIGNVIDASYRGECHAILSNLSMSAITIIQPGQKVAQMLIMPCYTGKGFQIVNKLSETVRNQGGFGSTGL